MLEFTRGLGLLFIVMSLQACQLVQQQPGSADERFPAREQAAVYNTQLGLAYLKQGDRARSKQKLVLALEQAPKSSVVNSAMAYYFEETSQFDQARIFYLKALSLAPRQGAELNNYGAFLCRQGLYMQAEHYFLQAVQDRQYLNTAKAYENAGLCAVASADYEKARGYLRKALELDPDRKQALNELVQLEKKQVEPTKMNGVNDDNRNANV